ncbi:TetR/AcrR family transcriptional regulator [Haliea sp. E17]|uniref:TetR/AcrR family transcriptional regulator n=1 Tax=Haliea sp. E17 TaxID=3401576 RepID=UPI003AADDCA3
MSKSAATRRKGRAGTSVWHSILDGAESILRDEGYAALSSRNVAGKAGVKQQLIYYYFHTMDELIVALFHRAADREIQALDQAISSDRPLSGMWEAFTHSQDNKLVSEFTALANRNQYLKAEVIGFIEKMRLKQRQALKRLLGDQPMQVVELPLDALVLVAAGLGLVMTRDAELGISRGHAEINRAARKLIAAKEDTGGG